MNKCSTCNELKTCIASTLTNSELLEFEGKVKVIDLKKGDSLGSLKSATNKINRLLTGLVKIEWKTRNNSTFVTVSQKGQFLGIESALEDKVLPYSCVCISNVTTCEIPVSTVSKFTQTNKAFCKFLFGILLNDREIQIKYFSRMISDTSQSKLALALSSLVTEDMYVTVTKEDIARMTGLTRETISRLLSKLNSEHIIQNNKREMP
jgi:CRP-like cAMP-binding protein